MAEVLNNPKIELLQEQIDNLEKSGFFTESEMDKLCGPLRIELESLKDKTLSSHEELLNSNENDNKDNSNFIINQE